MKPSNLPPLRMSRAGKSLYFWATYSPLSMMLGVMNQPPAISMRSIPTSPAMPGSSPLTVLYRPPTYTRSPGRKRYTASIAYWSIVRLEGSDSLERIIFADGREERRSAIFLRPPQAVAGELVEQLGCEWTDAGHIRIGGDNQTSVPGVYAAGDATTPLQQIVVAAASGAQAAMMLNRDLVRADFAAD